MEDRMARCSWCGEDLGFGRQWPDDYESCGKRECDREIRSMERADRENARLDAEADDFERYR